MTIQEILDHDWKIGEKLWEVYYIYPTDIGYEYQLNADEYLFPVGVIEITVKDFKVYTPKEKDVYTNVDVDFDGDWGSGQNVPYSNTTLRGMVSHLFGYNSYTGNFYEDKFFEKKDAEARYKEAVKKWNKKIKQLHKKQKDRLERAKAQYEKLLSDGLIDVERYTIKED